ncbi:MAG: hypothetical protein ABIP78_09180 [Pyrinomonadaceae bacterium]
MADKHSETRLTFDPLIQTENIAFDPTELIACTGCGRMNPPNRLTCIYCAKGIEIKIENASLIKPTLRKLELWERGFNIIVCEKANETDIVKLAQFLSMELNDLTAILDTNTPLPLARVESENEAAIIQTDSERCGIECTIISDADLAAEKLPVRLSTIDFRDQHLGLRDFNTGEIIEIAVADLALIVPGKISASRVDTLEKKRRRGNTKLIDETPTASDESILYIYSRQNSAGFRVHLTGFNFLCLGDDKGLIAVENLRLRSPV